MYRSVFKSALRHAPAARRMSTATPRASAYFPKVAVGASLIASSIFILPFAAVDNDTDKKKVAKDKEAAKEKAAEKTEKTETADDSANATDDKSESEPQGEGESQAAAFDPETGEINWDCPCLGGMAHGPCGEEFKEAFSCFVYSETEPKGIDCITKFEAMRTCFKAHPEHYKEELYEDDEPVPSTDDSAIEVTETVVEVPESQVEIVQPVEVDTTQSEEQTLQVEPDIVEVVTAELA